MYYFEKNLHSNQPYTAFQYNSAESRYNPRDTARMRIIQARNPSPPPNYTRSGRSSANTRIYYYVLTIASRDIPRIIAGLRKRRINADAMFYSIISLYTFVCVYIGSYVDALCRYSRSARRRESRRYTLRNARTPCGWGSLCDVSDARDSSSSFILRGSFVRCIYAREKV